jgi:hypothetical protein
MWEALMQEYLIVVRNRTDVVNLMSGYANANNIYNDAGRRVYVWTNTTSDDSDNFINLQALGVILGLLLLPTVETL